MAFPVYLTLRQELRSGRCVKNILDPARGMAEPGRLGPEARVRPRQFEEAAVLRIAFRQFRRKGVRATSLADVAREAGMQRGSLYNAFGSKQALFLAAYDRYREDYLATIAAALASGSLRERLEAFFAATIANFAGGDPPRGCPTTRGLLDVGAEDGDGLDDVARQAFAAVLSRLAGMLAQALRDGAARGEFAGDPDAAAWHLLTVARGLVVVERAFGDEAQLSTIAADAVDRLLR
jgi:AcrR family transcriptional regulator